MKFIKLIVSVLAILGLTASVAHARYHRHHHGGPRVSFGFSVGRPMYQPAYGARCYGGYCAVPVYVAAPIACTSCARPSFGVSFGSGPVSLGFGF